MVILHGGLMDGRLFLWGEMPAEAAGGQRKRPGRKKGPALPPPLPYSAPQEVLADLLAEVLPGQTPTGVGSERLVAYLPTAAEQPLASSGMIAETGAVLPAVTIAPWMVMTVEAGPEAIRDLLELCNERDLLGSGVVAGADLRFWSRALRLATQLVRRQSFLPTLQEDGKGYRASWQPVLSPGDEAAVLRLARSMPPVCRALGRPAGPPPEVSARTALRNFLSGMVDYLVRRSLSTGQVEAGAAAGDSPHDRWLQALAAPDGRLSGEASRWAALAAQVRDWTYPLRLVRDASFRLCLRLEEPGDEEGTEGGPWRLRYLLQSLADPSLLVSVADVWQGRDRSRTLERLVEAPREKVVAMLAQAAALSPVIEESLQAAVPEGASLDTTGAHRFLATEATLLEEAGFGVLLPAWWTGRGTRLRLSARAHVRSPRMSANAGLGMVALAEVRWEVALGGEPLSRRELQELARLKSPLVRIRGQWVQLNGEEIRSALDLLERKGGLLSLQQVMRLALGDGAAAGTLPMEGIEAEGGVADLLDRLSGRESFVEIPAPTGLRATLRPYQVRGYSWLHFLKTWGLGACLADDMGLGKTVQTLALLQRDWSEQAAEPVLLVCPTSVLGNWQREAERFAPGLPVLLHHGAGRLRGEAFRREAIRHALVLTSYSLLQRDQDLLREVAWRGIVLDEAQNIKNPQTRQSRAARSLPASYRIALTGTPVENHVGDLWSLMEFLNPGFLGSEAEFRRRFFQPIQQEGDAGVRDRLRRLTTPFILRRLKTDPTIISDLPGKVETRVYSTLTREQASLYAAVLQDMEEQIQGAEGIQRKGLILATLAKLKQVCNHPAQFLGDHSRLGGRSGKLARLEEMLEEVLAAGDRALIFTQFAVMGDLLRRHLEETFGREVLFLHGEVSREQRDRMVERFQQEEDGPSLFILSLKAGGTGLNLTRASHVFHFDRWWNPAVENQATDRAFRIGQKKTVQVHKFVCPGTFEERIDAMIEQKQELAEQVVGTGENWLTELSTDQLKNLFALGQEAVEEG